MNDRVQLVYQTGRGGKREVDVMEYPWSLYGNFSPPEYMEVAFAFIFGGSEEFAVRGKSRDDLIQLIKERELSDHPRLRYFTITDPDGNKEKLERGSPLT